MHVEQPLFIHMFLHDPQNGGSCHEQKVTQSKRHDSLARLCVFGCECGCVRATRRAAQLIIPKTNYAIIGCDGLAWLLRGAFCLYRFSFVA